MSGGDLPLSPKPPVARRPKYRALPGTVDTHFHIFGPTDKYPLSPQRMYDPPPSSVDEYLTMAATIGIDRMVVVQASVYGTDNTCLLDSIQQLGDRRTRGIAVVDQSITIEGLREMNRGGIRGIRFNAITGKTPIDWLPSLAKLIEPLGWHIQLWIKSDRLLEIAGTLKDIAVPIVLDHMGQFPVREGTNSVEFQNILRLIHGSNCWVKLTAYRVSHAAPSFNDIRECATALVATNPERCLWGSDWPHIYLEGRPMPNTTDLFELTWDWLSPVDRLRVFVDNPARLYRFD